MVKKILLILISFLLISCHKKTEKEILLIATDKSSFVNQTESTFKIFSDSTYLLNIIVDGNNYDKVENFKGHLKIKSDSIEFFPSRLEYGNSEKACLKNGFIEFINGGRSFRMKINSTKLKVNNLIDFSKFKEYAVFNYEKENENDKNVSFDMNETDIYEIENILKTEFKNKTNYQYNKYLKQIIGYKNINGEKYAQINCYCQNRDNLENFRKYVIQMNDKKNVA
jgi:hypothetical protein